ncbi:feruloyl esterase, partial [mine drainage metagenome]
RSILTTWSHGTAVPHRLVLRSKTILLAAQNVESKEIASRLGTTENFVSKWRRRFAQHRLAGIEEDAPRPGRPHIITPEQVQSVVNTARHVQPPNATHWSVRTLAKAVGLKRATVHEILRGHELKPHLTRTFKFSNRPPSFSRSSPMSSGSTSTPGTHARLLV